MCPSRLDSALWCFLVLQGVFRHLGYFLGLASQTCPIWTVSRDMLLGVPLMYFTCDMLEVILRSISSGDSTIVSGFCCCPLVWQVLLLSTCLEGYVVVWLYYRFCRALYCPFVPCSWGFSEVFAHTALRLQSMSQEVLSLPSIILFSLQRRSCRIYTLLSDGLTVLAVFTRFMLGKRD